MRDWSYGEYLDDVLKRAEPGTQLFTRADSDLFPGLYQMLIARRVDYVLGSSLEAAYAQKTYGGTIRVLPIAGELDHAVGYAGYPKTPFGQQLAAQMEVLIDKAWHDPEFLSIYTNLLDEPNRKIFNREVQNLVH